MATSSKPWQSFFLGKIEKLNFIFVAWLPNRTLGWAAPTGYLKFCRWTSLPAFSLNYHILRSVSLTGSFWAGYCGDFLLGFLQKTLTLWEIWIWNAELNFQNCSALKNFPALLKRSKNLSLSAVRRPPLPFVIRRPPSAQYFSWHWTCPTSALRPGGGAIL